MNALKMMAGVLLAGGLTGCTAMATSEQAATTDTAQGAATATAAKDVQAQDGLLTVRSNYSATESVQRIQDAVKAKGMTVFAVIDHQAAAREAGLSMPAATVVIFGNPKAGTPMMVQSPTLAIDLPLKALVWEDAEGNVQVSLNRAAYLGERHGVPADVYAPLAGAEKLIPAAVQ